MLLKIDQLLPRLYRLCGLLAALCIILIVLLVMVRIGSRITGHYIPGLSEYSGYCLALAGSLGLAYTFGEHGHIRVEMLIESLRRKTRFKFELVILSIASVMAGYVAFYMVKQAYISYLYEDFSTKSDEILLAIPQAPFALGFVMFTVCLVHTLIKAMATGQITYLQHEKMHNSK